MRTVPLTLDSSGTTSHHLDVIEAVVGMMTSCTDINSGVMHFDTFSLILNKTL